MLSGRKIKEEVEAGRIVISPFNEEQLNPNSYNLTIGEELLLYNEAVLDCRKKNAVSQIIINKDQGFVLVPGRIYLGCTEEWTETPFHIPFLEGRSSFGRLGLDIHATAGFGDIGFTGRWTLELSVKQPLRIYPFLQICQIGYHSIEGNFDAYTGRYQGSREVRSSLIHKDSEISKRNP